MHDYHPTFLHSNSGFERRRAVQEGLVPAAWCYQMTASLANAPRVVQSAMADKFKAKCIPMLSLHYPDPALALQLLGLSLTFLWLRQCGLALLNGCLQCQQGGQGNVVSMLVVTRLAHACLLRLQVHL